MGVGKSSVAHALAAIRRDRLGLRQAIATTAIDLARSLAHAVETVSTPEFRTRVHSCDLLLVDDVHQLASKPAAQQFLLCAIDALTRQGKLVIATLRQPPQATPDLLPQLASRLAGGLVVALSPPGYEARSELARQTARKLSVSLSEQEIRRIAQRGEGLADRVATAGKIRQAVIGLAAGAELKTGGDANALSDAADCDSLCRIARVIVGRHYGVPAAELKKSTRRKTVAAARALAMYMVRALASHSYAAIGKHFGGRDHTTVMHACRKLTIALEKDVALRRTVDELAILIAAEGGL